MNSKIEKVSQLGDMKSIKKPNRLYINLLVFLKPSNLVVMKPNSERNI